MVRVFFHPYLVLITGNLLEIRCYSDGFLQDVLDFCRTGQRAGLPQSSAAEQRQRHGYE